MICAGRRHYAGRSSCQRWAASATAPLRSRRSHARVLDWAVAGERHVGGHGRRRWGFRTEPGTADLMDLVRYMRVLRRRWRIIAVLALLGAVAGAVLVPKPNSNPQTGGGRVDRGAHALRLVGQQQGQLGQDRRRRHRRTSRLPREVGRRARPCRQGARRKRQRPVRQSRRPTQLEPGHDRDHRAGTEPRRGPQDSPTPSRSRCSRRCRTSNSARSTVSATCSTRRSPSSSSSWRA